MVSGALKRGKVEPLKQLLVLREGEANLVLDGDVFTADVDDIEKIR
jgi:hypothetical protein